MTLYTLTSFGPREWLRHHGYTTEGELEFRQALPPRRCLTIAQIQIGVASYFDIPVGEMTSARRGRAVARPRQVAMYISRQLTPRTLPEIGRRFGGRDHTTVIHAIKQIEKLQAQDRELATDVATLLDGFA